MRLDGVLTPWEESLGYRIEESEDFVEIFRGDRRVAVFGAHGDPELMRKAVEEDVRERAMHEVDRRRKLGREAAKEDHLRLTIRGLSAGQRLRQLEHEQQKLESYLELLKAQKEWIETQIAAVKLEKKGQW